MSGERRGEGFRQVVSEETRVARLERRQAGERFEKPGACFQRVSVRERERAKQDLHASISRATAAGVGVAYIARSGFELRGVFEGLGAGHGGFFPGGGVLGDMGPGWTGGRKLRR